MMTRSLSYSVGNEHSPTDPWGRSVLVIDAGGAVRLDHHFSRFRGVAAWTGVVAGEVLLEVWAAVERAGFPAAAGGPFVPDSRIGRLSIEGATAYLGDGVTGYADLVDILHGIIRQLSGDDVPFPSTRTGLVTGVRRV